MQAQVGLLPARSPGGHRRQQGFLLARWQEPATRLRERRRSQLSFRNSLRSKGDLSQSRILDQAPYSKPDDYSTAAYEVVLRARGQRDVQVWIAGYEIANFSPQAQETKQRIIHAATKIKNASIQKLVRRILAVGKLCGLLVERISTSSRHPWRNSRRWSKLQAETGGNIERCIVLRYDCRCRSHASVGQSDKFKFAVKRGNIRVKKAVAIVRFQIEVAGDLHCARCLNTA